MKICKLNLNYILGGGFGGWMQLLGQKEERKEEEMNNDLIDYDKLTTIAIYFFFVALFFNVS